MKNLTHILLMLFSFSLPALLHAQNRDDSKYLAGAVPEADGKVLFSKEFSISGMSQDEIYERMAHWMDERLKKNENNSRIVFTDKTRGQIVGTGEEWIVFSSSALSLDRTKVSYQLTVTCRPEKCVFEMGKIRFSYREGKEKYTAEEWITDKYALNKTKTKLVRGLAKWRRKTIDFADNLVQGVAESLSASTIQLPTVEKKEEQKTIVNSGPIVITPKKQVTTVDALQVAKVASAEQSQTTITTTSNQQQGYKPVLPEELSTDAIQTGSGKLVIVIGDDPFNMTMMTANSGGSLGKVNGKPVVFSILSSDQPYEQMEKAESYEIRFYPTGQITPTLILECKKLPSPAVMEGMPRTYLGEIMKAMVKVAD